MQTQQNPSAVRLRPHRFRRKLLIFPKFQLPVIGINLGVIFVMSLIIWVGMQNAFLDLKPAAGLSGSETEYFKHYLDYQVSRFERSLFISLGAGALVSTLLTLIITHRFSGPLVRLRNHFRTICAGASPIAPLEFRDGDYLSDLPPLVNGAFERVEAGKKRAG